MDLVGPYRETKNGNQYALMVICMLTSYISMITIRSKITEEVIKAYLTGVYYPFKGSEYILSDCGSEFTTKQFTFLAKELGFIRVYTSPYTPTGNSIIECMHSFLKASIRKLTCNNEVDWDKTVDIGSMAYNIFPHSWAGESLLYLMFGYDPFMPTLFKLLLPKCRYMGDKKCRIHLDAIWEIYMMAVMNLKMAWDKSPPLSRILVKQILR